MVLINDNSTALAIGDSIPSFTLPATDGMTVDSSTIKDPVLAVIFTCNHCPYAQAYEDRLIDLANEFDEQGVQFVLISSNDSEGYPADSFDQMKSDSSDANAELSSVREQKFVRDANLILSSRNDLELPLD